MCSIGNKGLLSRFDAAHVVSTRSMSRLLAAEAPVFKYFGLLYCGYRRYSLKLGRMRPVLTDFPPSMTQYSQQSKVWSKMGAFVEQWMTERQRKH